METRSLKLLLSKNNRRYPRTAALGKKGKKGLNFSSSFLTAAGGANYFYPVANCQHADKNHLMRRSTLDLDIDSAHAQPAWGRPRPTSIDDGLEDIRRTHGLGGESLPAASYGILSNLQKTIFAIRDGRRIFIICLVHTSGQLFFYHKPGQRPPHVTGHCVNAVTLGWVRAPDERPLCRIHDAVAGGRCCRSMAAEDSESQRFEPNIRPSFF